MMIKNYRYATEQRGRMISSIMQSISFARVLPRLMDRSIMPQSRRRIASGASIVAPLLALGLWLLAPRVPAAASPPAASAEHNGQDDFDFLFGRWKVHLKRKVPGTDRWTDSDGYGNYRKIWGVAPISTSFSARARTST